MDEQDLTAEERAEVAAFVLESERLRLAGLASRTAEPPDGDVPLPVATAQGHAGFLGALADDRMPLVRTDFSDDAAWQGVVVALTARDRMPGLDAVVIEDTLFEGANGLSLAELVRAEPTARGYAVLADERTMREARDGADWTVVLVDLSLDEDEDDPELLVDDSHLGRTFRCGQRALSAVAVTLELANLSFGEIADLAGADGLLDAEHFA